MWPCRSAFHFSQFADFTVAQLSSFLLLKIESYTSHRASPAQSCVVSACLRTRRTQQHSHWTVRRMRELEALMDSYLCCCGIKQNNRVRMSSTAVAAWWRRQGVNMQRECSLHCLTQRHVRCTSARLNLSHRGIRPQLKWLKPWFG